MTIAMLADEEADLREQVRAYRELALAGVHALHDVTRDRDRLRKAYYKLLDEHRALRSRQRTAA